LDQPLITKSNKNKRRKVIKEPKKEEKVEVIINEEEIKVNHTMKCMAESD